MIASASDANLIEELLARLEKRSSSKPAINPKALQIRSKQWQGTERLRRLCLDLVTNFGPSTWADAESGILAAEILSEQFSHDPAVRLEMEAAVDKVPNTSAITVALCNAWSHSVALKAICNDQPGRLMTPAQICLFSCSAGPDDFVNVMEKVLSKLTGNLWDFLPTSARALEARLKCDAQSRENAFRWLEAGGSATVKANFPQFLRRTDNRLVRLQAWARNELKEQNDGKHLPDCALDIFTGRIRPVSHILMELLSN